MGFYKYYILFTAISAMVMDFHISCFYGIYIFFPQPITCATGIARFFNYYFGSILNYQLMHFTLSATGLSVLAGFLYRYHSLKNDLDFFHQKKMIIILGLAVLLYPVPCLIPNWIQYRYSKEDGYIWVQKNYPELFYVYSHWTCSGFYDKICMELSIIIAMIQIFFIGGLIVYYAVKCIKLLNSVKHSLTPATFALQKQLLVVLCFQVVIPVCCLLIPTTILFIAMITGSENMSCE
ncbi:hypothetical protein FO519_008938 [Halicephalobus sp. NKZ332]|nr:hypothetical protein FO519_008938 [Halicephalobus sp. NKZ332]